MMKYLIIYGIWVDCTFSIHMKSSIHMLSQKTLRWGFLFEQEWLNWKTKLWKNYFHLKCNKNYVEGLHVKIHLHVYPNTKKEKRKTSKIIQNVLTK